MGNPEECKVGGEEGDGPEYNGPVSRHLLRPPRGSGTHASVGGTHLGQGEGTDSVPDTLGHVEDFVL